MSKIIGKRLKALGKETHYHQNRKIVPIPDLKKTIRACINTNGEYYLSNVSLFSILHHLDKINQKAYAKSLRF